MRNAMRIRHLLPCLAMLVAATAYGKATSKPAERRPAHVEVARDAQGFTITQKVRVSSDARGTSRPSPC
jgi:hypothetical protein